MVFNYIYRFGLQLWRRKTSVLLTIALLLIITAGLNYNRSDLNLQLTVSKDEKTNIDTKNEGVHFVGSKNEKRKSQTNSVELDVDALRKIEQPSRDDIANRLDEDGSDPNVIRDIEQRMGVPYVNLDTKNPYIPKQRLVHFDFKGAPPKVSYLKRILPLIKTLGATGILLEYEDMFPYKGILKDIAAKNCYSEDDIRTILQSAEEHNLEVIPLVQTFGHVEFALKHIQWAHLREVPDSPQALCPSRNQSIDYIKEMVDQVMSFHPKIKYLHIGCDEVFQMGQCELCRLESYENLFLKHVKKVAELIHAKYPHLKLIIWDDMLRHVSQQSMLDINFGNLVEPMVWVYAEDIYRFVQTQVWEKYAAVFKTAWTASAYKGAFGETLYIPDARRHLENNLRWLEVMSQQENLFKNGFSGIALTGWQRYDHFAVLCELFPAAFPSLALCLTAVSHGYFNRDLKQPIMSALSCPNSRNHREAFVSLESDPHLWDKLGRCVFPGSAFFRLTQRLRSSLQEAGELLEQVRQRRAWLTEYNARRNYSLGLRLDELTSDLPRVSSGLNSLARNVRDALLELVDWFTVAEWLEQLLYPLARDLDAVRVDRDRLRAVQVWESRPLAPLQDLRRLGIQIPDEL